MSNPIRMEFTLSMPGTKSWNGKWSGDSKRYAIVREVSSSLLAMCPQHSWGYNFGDGWYASVSGRILAKGERVKKSDGFCGYDWMVDSIVMHGTILNEQQRHAKALNKALEEVNAAPTTTP